MKYTGKRIRKLLEDYFREVAANNWEDFEEDGYKDVIDKGRFKMVENFVQVGDGLPTEDVLFFLSGTVASYRVFLIKENRLIEVHQEHGSRWCLTCAELGIEWPYESKPSEPESSPF